jgi:membrane-associated phospholipid phosphatase
MSPTRGRLPRVPIPVRVDRMDAVIDDWFETHLRGRPTADRLMYTASAVGDHSFIWIVVALLQAARRRGDWWRPLARTIALLGIESALINGPVKWLFRRTRPEFRGPRPRPLRQPLTSSFPSGHATSAFFAAAVLRDDPFWPLYYAAALVIAASRVHVKIHHASDVMGGIVIGTLLGQVARRLTERGLLAMPARRAGGQRASVRTHRSSGRGRRA